MPEVGKAKLGQLEIKHIKQIRDIGGGATARAMALVCTILRKSSQKKPLQVIGGVEEA